MLFCLSRPALARPPLPYFLVYFVQRLGIGLQWSLIMLPLILSQWTFDIGIQSLSGAVQTWPSALLQLGTATLKSFQGTSKNLGGAPTDSLSSYYHPPSDQPTGVVSGDAGTISLALEDPSAYFGSNPTFVQFL